MPFKPQINAKPRTDCTYLIEESNNLKKRPETSRVSVVERTKLWSENRMKKIESIKESTANKDIEGCTFKP